MRRIIMSLMAAVAAVLAFTAPAGASVASSDATIVGSAWTNLDQTGVEQPVISDDPAEEQCKPVNARSYQNLTVNVTFFTDAICTEGATTVIGTGNFGAQMLSYKVNS